MFSSFFSKRRLHSSPLFPLPKLAQAAHVSAGPVPMSKKSAYGKVYTSYDDRLQAINNGKRNQHHRLKSADAVHNQFRHFEDHDRCACRALGLLCVARGTRRAFRAAAPPHAGCAHTRRPWPSRRRSARPRRRHALFFLTRGPSTAVDATLLQRTVHVAQASAAFLRAAESWCEDEDTRPPLVEVQLLAATSHALVLVIDFSPAEPDADADADATTGAYTHTAKACLPEPEPNPNPNPKSSPSPSPSRNPKSGPNTSPNPNPGPNPSPSPNSSPSPSPDQAERAELCARRRAAAADGAPSFVVIPGIKKVVLTLLRPASTLTRHPDPRPFPSASASASVSASASP